MEIQSTSNTKVKQWVKLLSKKGRQEQRKFLVEGVSAVKEALEAKAPVDCVVYSLERGLPEEIRNIMKGNQVETYAVSEPILKKCTDASTPQSVFAAVHIAERKQVYELLEVEDANCKQGMYVLCDGIQDPGNLGTIIRSADAAGAAGVIVSPDSVDIYHPKVIRSTMGSLFHLPVIVQDLTEAVEAAKTRNITVWTTSPLANVSCYEADLAQPAWFVIGNEARGVSEGLMRYIDNSLYIPMQGKAESLNAAMAATVLLFEGMRQKMA